LSKPSSKLFAHYLVRICHNQSEQQNADRGLAVAAVQAVSEMRKKRGFKSKKRGINPHILYIYQIVSVA
jgi:hypothetical protein